MKYHDEAVTGQEVTELGRVHGPMLVVSDKFCPDCGSPMTGQMISKAGNPFAVCWNYPQCHFHKRIKKSRRVA